jgi:hypothetical protein
MRIVIQVGKEMSRSQWNAFLCPYRIAASQVQGGMELNNVEVREALWSLRAASILAIDIRCKVE